MKIIILTGSLSLPRVINRIESLHTAGYDIDVYGYNRNIYENNFPDNVNIKIISDFVDGQNYLSKLITIYKDLKFLIKFYKQKNTDSIFYFISIPFASIVAPLFNIKYFYEISDIRYEYK